MAHTNETPNYHLPQFVGTDIINPLVDTNGAYSAIDTALKDISDNEVTDAGKILALETTVGDSSAGLVKDVTDLQTQNGDSVLTTDAQTLSAAINEVDAHTDTNTGNIADNALAITGLQNTVGNANSGLVKDVADLQTKVGSGTLNTVAQNCVGGINEVAGLTLANATELTAVKNEMNNKYITGGLEYNIVSHLVDGVKSYSQLIDDMRADLATYLATLGDTATVELVSLNIAGLGSARIDSGTFVTKLTNVANLTIRAHGVEISPTNGNVTTFSLVSYNGSCKLTCYRYNKGTNTIELVVDETYVPTDTAQSMALRGTEVEKLSL